MICISATDSVAPAGPTERYARQARAADIRVHDAGHFDFYTGSAFRELVAEQTDFLVKHLRPTRAGQGPGDPGDVDGGVADE